MTLDRRQFVTAAITAAAATNATYVPARSNGKTSFDRYTMGTRRELFLDDFLIEHSHGKVAFELHHPIPREQVIHHDRPWEGTASGYHTVIQDGSVYRLYYRGFNFDLVNNNIHPTNQEVTCYAESTDGIHWEKPVLGLHEQDGSAKNNIVWQGSGSHNFSPFLDRRPGCPDSERFKAFGGLKRDGGMLLFQSPDGIHWKKSLDQAVITKGAFDSANTGFWDPTIQKYRAYWRYFTEGITEADNWKPAGIRAIRTAVSDDLIDWSGEHDLEYTDSPDQQIECELLSALHGGSPLGKEA